ncbi:zinc finger protein 541-like [Manis javanica]|uniref:zinc finger protein 541-like n=1 Tax=Manis javanica TaxID=9974 RepID=UPI003C6D6C53
MLTHQQTKPFACMEQGCSKSYCEDRSLRRHYQVQHGLCILKEAPPKEEACGDSSPAHEVAGQPAADGLRSLVPPEARSPGPFLSNREPLRSIVSSTVHQDISSLGPVLAGPSDDGEGKNTACPSPPSLGPYPCTPAAPRTLGTDVPEECHPLWKEPAAGFTTIHSREAEDGGPDPAESERPPQLPPTLESGQEGGTLPAGLPLFQGQAVPASAQPSSHNYQWLQNLPGCPESEGNGLFTIQKPTSVSPQEFSEAGPRPSSTSLTGERSPSGGRSLEDALPLPPTDLKAPGEASHGPGYAGQEGDTRASKKSDSDSDSCGLSSDNTTPLSGQLFLKSQECLVSPGQMQVFHMITKSQVFISGSQVAVASSQHAAPEGKQAALKPLQGPRPHQPPPLAPTVDSFHPGPANPEPEGSPPHKRKTTPAFPREALPGSNRRDTKGGPKVAPAPWEPPGNPDISSLAKQLRSTKGPLDLGDILPTGGPWQTQLGGDNPAGAQLPGKQAQVENGLASGAMKGAKGLACSRGRGRRLFSGNMWAQCFLDFQKEKVKMDTHCAASPSQVAMASFSLARPSVDTPQDSKSKLMIPSRTQGGNTYQLPDPVKEESTAGGCNQQNGGPAEWAEPRSTCVCRNCSPMFHTQEGLTSHTCFPNDQWLPPRGNQDQQGQDGHQERDAEETSQPRKRRKRPQPKASFLPPAPSASGGLRPEEGHQSCLWSPVLLVDHSLQGLCSRSPDTPSPVLSPIREGSGLDSSTLCSMSTQAVPDKLISTELDQVNDSSGIFAIKDDTELSTEPCIRIGREFQAEIPELQQRPTTAPGEHGASLVWKPSDDMMTNGETQDRVTELCNLACSSTMPGGGTNLELALHCLHEAQGEVPVALETLLLSGPQKPPTHPLADYHYAGSAVWTPTEKELFNKAFQAHKNNFSLIHKMVQTKSVAQCVEYYYTWKKRVRFTTSSRAPGLKKSVKRKLAEADPTETKATASPKKRRNHHPTPELKTETESCRGQSVANTSPNAAPKQTPEPLGCVQGQGAPCGECERVFDKMCTHYAHMKRHRNEDPVETTVGEERPAKAFKVSEDEAGRASWEIREPIEGDDGQRSQGHLSK